MMKELSESQKQLKSLKQDIESLSFDRQVNRASSYKGIWFNQALNSLLMEYNCFTLSADRDVAVLEAYSKFAGCVKAFVEHAGSLSENEGLAAQRTVDLATKYIETNCPDIPVIIEQGYEAAKSRLEYLHETARANLTRLNTANSPKAGVNL